MGLGEDLHQEGDVLLRGRALGRRVDFGAD